MENNRKISPNSIPAQELMRLAVKFNVSFQKIKAAVYTLGHDLKDIEAWLTTRKQKLGTEYQGFSRSRSSV